MRVRLPFGSRTRISYQYSGTCNSYSLRPRRVREAHCAASGKVGKSWVLVLKRQVKQAGGAQREPPAWL